MKGSTRHVLCVRARSQHRRSSGAGFTLVELTISLVAGLLVAMAVMGVSKEATNTFHEEVRISGAEMGLRIAMERIRLDLQRAAYMGTGNILGDPLIARLANYSGTLPLNLSNYSGSGAPPYSVANLSGVTVYPQATTPSAGLAVPSTVVSDTNGSAQLALQSAGNPPFPALLTNPLLPDVVDIAGNMSSSDEYAASIIWNPPSVPSGCAPGVAIQLEMTSPAGWRIRNAETLAAAASATYVAGSALQAIFHPGVSLTSSFMLRVTDLTGHYQYLIGCAGANNPQGKVGGSAIYCPPGAGGGSCPTSTLPTALLFLANTSPVVTSTAPANPTSLLNNLQTGGQGGVPGFGAGVITVSPLQIARWNIQTPAQLNAAMGAVSSATATNNYFYNATYNSAATQPYTDQMDFLLTRSYVDVGAACSGTGAGAPCPVDPFTTEVISEYAVDLKFGLTVDPTANTGLNAEGVAVCGPSSPALPNCGTTPPLYTADPLVNIPMDSAVVAFKGWSAVEGAYAYNVGPQRIRNVQVRVGIRSPFGDRAASLPVPLGTTSSSAIPDGYLYRYLLNGGTTGSPHFQSGTPYARVREATTEVNLPNQARYYW